MGSPISRQPKLHESINACPRGPLGVASDLQMIPLSWTSNVPTSVEASSLDKYRLCFSSSTTSFGTRSVGAESYTHYPSAFGLQSLESVQLTTLPALR